MYSLIHLSSPCAQVKQRVGPSTYEALRAMIVQHQELFNQQIHELHCLTRKQRLLEASLSRPAAYQAELQRLAAQAQVGGDLAPVQRLLEGVRCVPSWLHLVRCG